MEAATSESRWDCTVVARLEVGSSSITLFHSRYASFELPNEQIVSLDLQRGTDLWVSFSDSSYEEALKLAAWLDACRTFDLPLRIQGVAL